MGNGHQVIFAGSQYFLPQLRSSSLTPFHFKQVSRDIMASAFRTNVSKSSYSEDGARFNVQERPPLPSSRC
jgi:hypothetical protein